MTEKQFEKFEAILEKLERRVTRIEKVLKPKEVSETDKQMEAMDDLVANLKESVLDRIKGRWRENQTPTENRILAQIFGRRAQPIGGVDTIIRILIDENEVESVMRLTGARLFVPKGALAKMTHEEIEVLREFGMRESDIRRYRERENLALKKRSAAKLTPEEEAEIERQNAAFVAQVEKQQGIV